MVNVENSKAFFAISLNSEQSSNRCFVQPIVENHVGVYNFQMCIPGHAHYSFAYIIPAWTKCNLLERLFSLIVFNTKKKKATQI